MRQAITTKYLGPTNTRGSRIKATAAGGSITIPYDNAGSADSSHAKAAKALADKLGWDGLWTAGGLPSQDGNVYVWVDGADSTVAELWKREDARGEGADWFLVPEPEA